MEKLSLRTQELISNGLRTVGFETPGDPYSYIEEHLYVDEAEDVLEFLKWLWAINRPYGPANAQQRWLEFKKGDKAPSKFYILFYTFTCTIGTTSGVIKQSARMSTRLSDSSIESVRKAMVNSNKDLDYDFTVKEFSSDCMEIRVVCTYTKAQVFDPIKVYTHDEYLAILTTAVAEAKKCFFACIPTPVQFVQADLLDRSIGKPEPICYDGDCGGAYINGLSGNSPFIRWAKKNFPEEVGSIKKGVYKGYTIYLKKDFFDGQTQSAEKHTAYATGFCKVLSENGIRCSVKSYLT